MFLCFFLTHLFVLYWMAFKVVTRLACPGLFDFECTVKHMYNDHPRDPKFVAVVDKWSLFRGPLCYKDSNRDSKTVVNAGWSSLYGVGC